MINRKVSTAEIQVFYYLLNITRWNTFVLSDVHSGLERNCVFLFGLMAVSKCVCCKRCRTDHSLFHWSSWAECLAVSNNVAITFPTDISVLNYLSRRGSVSIFCFCDLSQEYGNELMSYTLWQPLMHAWSSGAYQSICCLGALSEDSVGTHSVKP